MRFFNLAAIAMLLSPLPLSAFSYQEGDLVFQAAGNSKFSNAIEVSTGISDSLNFIHVGIIKLNSFGDIEVIEASPSAGVTMTPIDRFLSSASTIDNKPGVVVKRLSGNYPVEQFIKNALTHIGEPYDWYYLPDNGMMYCSELVYESYTDSCGVKIFEAHPMNFRAPDGSLPEFWIDLYKELGVDVPEGIPGTNPNDLSKDPHLKEVFRYF